MALSRKRLRDRQRPLGASDSLEKLIQLGASGAVESIGCRGDDAAKCGRQTGRVLTRRLDEPNQRGARCRGQCECCEPGLRVHGALDSNWLGNSLLRERIMREPRREIGRQDYFAVSAERRASGQCGQSGEAKWDGRECVRRLGNDHRAICGAPGRLHNAPLYSAHGATGEIRPLGR